jgi:glycosyltransferase involved in cell wall biosynthesis
VKIAHLVIAGDVAGGQIVALRLLRAARAAGHDVLVVAPKPGPFVDLVRADGVQVELIDVNRLFRADGAWRLLRLLRRERPDVLHTHTAVAANVISRIAGRLTGVSVVAHMHIENHFRPNRFLRTTYRALDNWSARLCEAILVVSDDTRRAFVDQGYPVELLETIHNGIDLDELEPGGGGVREQLGVPEGATLIGEVGRLCDVKGQRELIDATALLRDGGHDAHVVLVGEDLEQAGEYRAQLERQARELGVDDRVVFAGYRDDVPAVLDALDLFVLPSWIEGLPLVLLEAMAHRRPVVATPVGGTPELVVDGETGILVPPRDPAALAGAIAELLDDDRRRIAYGEAGFRRVAERFSAHEMERRVLEAYDRVAARRGRSSGELRILHVVIDGELAGGQLVARKLIAGAAERGHRSLIVSPTRGPFTEEAERDGIAVEYVDVSRSFKLVGLWRLRRLVRRERVDVVHTHGMFASNLLSRVAARSAGAAVVGHVHGPGVFPRLGGAYRLVDNLTSRLCDRLIAVSDHTRRELLAQGIPERLIEVVRNGFDPPQPPPESRNGSRLIVCVGRVEPMKGQADLIRALTQVPDARLLVVGRDVRGHRAELEALAAELGVAGRVELAGVRTDVLELLADAAVLALPSYSEGFPIVPLEAMAVKLPVVATAVGGTPELVVDGETGILVEPGDVDALAAALRAVLDDPQRARAMGEAGYRRLLERLPEDAMVERVQQIWLEAVR